MSDPMENNSAHDELLLNGSDTCIVDEDDNRDKDITENERGRRVAKMNTSSSDQVNKYYQTKNRRKIWKRLYIENNGMTCPVTIMEQIVSAFVEFNRRNSNARLATKFAIGWCPRSVAEVVYWIEELVKKIIIIDAKIDVDQIPEVYVLA